MFQGEQLSTMAAMSENKRPYLKRMAPNTKGDEFAWLDPSAMYMRADSFHPLLDDLQAPFADDAIDVVAGIDAMGFVLGSALAVRLGTGFLAVRKAGKIPLDTDVVQFSNYSGRTQDMELRKPAFAPGTRVLLVDQWIETGGTMNAAIQLIERQQGVVAGVATVCIESNGATATLQQRYKCVSAVIRDSDIQGQCDQQTLDSFEQWTPESVFPERRTK